MRPKENEFWSTWEQRFARFLDRDSSNDIAHDRAHIQRVVTNAKGLSREENAQLAIVIPAAWLHDCVTVSKDSEHRQWPLKLAADKAGNFLQESGYPVGIYSSH